MFFDMILKLKKLLYFYNLIEEVLIEKNILWWKTILNKKVLIKYFLDFEKL